MGKPKTEIFSGDSDSDREIKIENEYAKNYDNWRQKEELNKLKSKYGDNILDESESSSSSDDEDAVELTEEVEKDFFKTLSYLKKKDPKIYDNNVSFFRKYDHDIKKEKKKKDEPMFIKDYERKILLEKGGIIEEDSARPLSNVEEDKCLQEEIISYAANIEEHDDDDLLQVRKKTKEETEQETEYVKWLSGQEIEDNEIKSELKPLKDFWNNPNLDNGEKFLRDYVLKKRYVEKDDDNEYVPTYDEIIHDSDKDLSEDEKQVEKQEEFEHKYNFRFEEPDQEFIKRYPRTIEQSLRKTDERRKMKRAETKERKKKEKEEKMAEIKKLQELKRKEIEEKIEKLKEITGNKDLGIQENDIDGDFDPEAHDKRMQSLFNDDFYEGPEGDQKPEFPDIDEELEIESWDHWNGDNEGFEEGETEYGPHCEDDSFNMDADYDPSSSNKQELIENTKGKKKRRRKSKVIEALKRPKPKYDPNDKNYEKYFDEYYKLDCEDIISDIPCRFKYREVIPNDFGLSIEEILLAKDKELNRWCSIKKAIQHRPADVEKYDQIAYSKKAYNVALKRRILPSLFSEEADEEQRVQQPSTTSDNIEDNEHATSNNIQIESEEQVKKKNNNETQNDEIPMEEKQFESGENIKKNENIKSKKNKKKRKSIELKNDNKSKKKLKMNKDSADVGISDARLSAYGINPKKFKNKLKYDKKQIGTIPENKTPSKSGNNDKNVGKKNSNKRKAPACENDNKGKKKFKKDKDSVNVGISDARLSAYGINPKKFKNKLKYGNKK